SGAAGPAPAPRRKRPITQPPQTLATLSPGPAPQGVAGEEFDPIAWEVPVICKDCNEPWTIPYRHFQAGVVFYCPSCSGSYVPKSTMARTVREIYETFYARRKAEREVFERRQVREREAFEAKQTADMEEFKCLLHALARDMNPT